MKTFEDKCIAGNMLWQILNMIHPYQPVFSLENQEHFSNTFHSLETRSCSYVNCLDVNYLADYQQVSKVQTSDSVSLFFKNERFDNGSSISSASLAVTLRQ